MKKTQYSISEHNLIYLLLIASAGMMGAYTFILRGNVFCNAQTANVVLMSIKFGQGDWLGGLYFLIPMSAYLGGALISELLSFNLKKDSYFKWNTYLVAIEMAVLLGIGFIPAQENTHHIVQVLVNLLASMQFTTFRKAQGIPMATTFCTNHIRQIGIALATAMHDRDKKPLKRGLVHFSMLLCFFLGGIVLASTTNALGEMSIFLCELPLGIVLIMLIYGDILAKRSEKLAKSCIYDNGENKNDDNAVETYEVSAIESAHCTINDMANSKDKENDTKDNTNN